VVSLAPGHGALAAWRARAFPAWNNLGVALHDEGCGVHALDAFRHAVGARDGYALGWFNLGVALERRGPLHVLAGRGAIAEGPAGMAATLALLGTGVLVLIRLG
jgi:hypothetical protein